MMCCYLYVSGQTFTPAVLAATALGSGILDSLEEAGDTPPELDDTPGGLTAAVRHKLAALASCWAQLVHKAQTVFQNNAKLEVSRGCRL